ncbi:MULTISPECIES: C40 family peptidase [Streptomyces]|uniref:NlpC/P60 family protein n=1 Tax=Streptomyces maoxianensis TaxID=1459942 RepID=A0ABV9G1K4_9ACTN|nr:C40 family peptidase [Streptomyces sp. ISL-1]MBT2391235.1 C40 family peptidase [Streptomyces sp. ISL-1]
MNRRRCATAAITLVCALTVLASPGQAFAAPGPPPPAGQGVPKKTLEQVRLELDSLYRKASSATDAYNLAEEQADKQSAEIVRLAQEIVKGQARIDDLKNRVGATARAQYRGGGLPPEAQLVLTDDPQLFLDGAGRIQQGQKATRDLLGELTRTQADLAAYSKDASAQWRKLEANRLKQAKAKKEINDRIAAAKKIEDRLEKQERERLLQLEQQAQYNAQTAWLSTGALKDVNSKASAQGKKAIRFATQQIGKPYVWGAEGPGSYDCSGLTSQAWAAAGRGIPRTSQEQWRLLPRIAVKDMRPGDLIIYHADASHVGMYIGDGAIVHAPRPGRNVTITGAGSMAILGVVRPDK